ncbi:MAG TPA: cysteine synthase family protein [Chitinophagaceae bacterium]|nr:cysteine synthase family protein [Chitinophagaceae bacterium]
METILKKFNGTEIEKKIDHLWHLIGNTPMLEILYEHKGKRKTIYAKCEHYTLTGSIKDRMALYILQKAYSLGKIKPGNRIVEASSGNTGISFSSIGRNLGHHVTIIMPDWLSKERTDIIRSLGAQVISISKEKGGFLGSIELSLEMAAKDPNVFLPRQFENSCNAEAHQKTTAREIWQQLAAIGLKPDAFVAGVGTGGTLMGMNAYLRKKNPYIKVHPIEPKESPTLSTGYKIGNHRIQGISDEFIPSIVNLGELDDIIPVSDGDAILMSQKMAKQLGIAVGISSGANMLGAIQAQQYLGNTAVVVTVLSDSNKKYLSTDLMNEEPIKEGYLSPQVQLIDCTPLKRMDSDIKI